MNDSIKVPPPQNPSVSEETAVRTFQRDILAAHFTANALMDFGADELKALVGDNYRSRISDCVKQLGMNIVNVPRYRTWEGKNGKVMRQRLIGAYKYLPYRSLGPDANAPRAVEGWLF